MKENVPLIISLIVNILLIINLVPLPKQEKEIQEKKKKAFNEKYKIGDKYNMKPNSGSTVYAGQINKIDYPIVYMVYYSDLFRDYNLAEIHHEKLLGKID